MTPDNFLHSPEGAARMHEQVQLFFDLLHQKLGRLRIEFPNDAIYIRENKHLSGGYDFVINKHSLVSQYYLPSANTTTDSMLSLALFDLVFDHNGHPMDENGLPMGHYDAERILRHIRYSLGADDKLDAYWIDRENNVQVSTTELFEDWIGRLMQLAIKH